MTWNPNWVEIKQEFAKKEEVNDRPDLVTRFFRAKLEALKKELFKKEIVCLVAAFVYAIGFQKKGLPHVNLLFILKSYATLVSLDDFDSKQYIYIYIYCTLFPLLRFCHIGFF